MAADEEVLVVVEIADRVRDRVQIVADVTDLVDQTVVDRVVVAAQVEPRPRTEPDAAIQEAVVVAAHENARLAGLDGVASMLDLPDRVVTRIVRQVRDVASVDDTVRRIFQPQGRRSNRQPCDADVLASAQIQRQLTAFCLDHLRHRAAGRNQVQRAVLPMPFPRRVQGVPMADDHPPPLLVLLRELAVVGGTEPPALRAVPHQDFARSRALDHAGLRTPALKMDAAVQRALPVVVRLTVQQLAHDPTRLTDPRFPRDRELAVGRPQR